jgi:hypothetical protein
MPVHTLLVLRSVYLEEKDRLLLLCRLDVALDNATRGIVEVALKQLSP